MSGAALTIGNFDGVHLGHRALIERARALAGSDGQVVAMAFWPHPISVLRPRQSPATLTTFDRRAQLLRELGADAVVRLEPTRDLLALEPEAFLRLVVGQHHPTAIVEGEDFRFGRARAGTVRTLADLGASMGFRADVVPPVRIATADQLVADASSTLARWMIAEGRVRDAAGVLGRPHRVVGVVASGARRGRDLGFPTANLNAETMLPADGVYAGLATLPDGSQRPAAVSVGTNPTFGAEARRLEAHILDWSGPADDYGWTLSIDLIAWLRDQVAYRGVQPLIEQIHRDIADTRSALEREGVRWRIASARRPVGAETGAA
ncbi:MAG: bifunctional riboflavin kinase/FMN adenylyltransferase [Phycisphaerales bacterium]